MLIYRDDFLRVRDNIVKRFEECSEKTYDALAECVSDSLICDADIYAVAMELELSGDIVSGDTPDERVFTFMYEYMLDCGYIKCIDA